MLKFTRLKRDFGGETHASPLSAIASGIISQTLRDLINPQNTEYVYAAWFFSDYCKKLFACTSIEYNEEKIREIIDKRPFGTDETGIETINGYLIRYRNGYVEEITKGDTFYRLPEGKNGLDKSYKVRNVLNTISNNPDSLIEGV